MRYSAITKEFSISVKDLEFIALSVPYIIRHIRLLAGLPLDKYEQKGPMTNADFAMRGVIEMAERIGVDFGCRFGEELDVRKAE
jgi:hypothetical protein